MPSISGFFRKKSAAFPFPQVGRERLFAMNRSLLLNGPSDQGVWTDGAFGLAIAGSPDQPYVKTLDGHTWAITANASVFNQAELREDLAGRGHVLESGSVPELLLAAYLEYGPEFPSHINGTFALAIADPGQNRLLLYRDRFGTKPLFYALDGDTLVFSSQLKGLFSWPGIAPVLDQKGLNEIFSLGPAKTRGSGVFAGIHEVLPGQFLLCSPDGLTSRAYWKLESHPHEDGYQETVEKTSFLVEDAVRRQMASETPVCAFLSGGVDSSLVSSICARELKKQNRQLTTFSFDFSGNREHFQANAFQPSLDRPYVEQMVTYLDSDHHYLECGSADQLALLETSVLAHDLPAMADVDSSMMYFCSLVAPTAQTALTGECADEIFGGYPWFHKEECLTAHTFPWTMDLSARQVLLSDDFLSQLGMEEYVKGAYETSLSQVPALSGETGTAARQRQISYLNLTWFMQTLLDRMDRASGFFGLDARVPFADHRIVEYLWNVPWEMKAKDGIVKNLLRQAGQGLLPDEILFRKKSPYPKTYDRGYEAMLAGRVREILEDPSSPVLRFLDREKTLRFLESPSDYGKPWYGQLMAAPQMMAYVIQVDVWLRMYRPEIKF